MKQTAVEWLADKMEVKNVYRCFRHLILTQKQVQFQLHLLTVNRRFNGVNY